MHAGMPMVNILGINCCSLVFQCCLIVPRMRLTSGRASGRKNAAPILFIDTQQFQRYRKTDYEPMMMNNNSNIV